MRGITLLLSLTLLLAACGDSSGGPGSPDLVVLTLGSAAFGSIASQGVPTDPGTGLSVIQEVEVEVLDGAGVPVAFNSDLVYTPGGAITTLLLTPATPSLTIQLPSGDYSFKSRGNDAAATFLAYGLQPETIAPGASVNLALSTLLGTAELTPRTPITYVLAGQVVDVMLTVTAPDGSSSVPFDSFSVNYGFVDAAAAATGTVVSSSRRGVRGEVALGSFTEFVVNATVDGWVTSGSDGVAGQLVASFSIPVQSGSLGTDLEAPTLTFDSPGPLTPGTPVTLTGTATDNLGVQRLRVFEGPVLIASSDPAEFADVAVEQVSFSGTAWSVTWTPTAEVLDLTAVVTDASGNQSEVTVAATAEAALWGGTVQYGSSATDQARGAVVDAGGNILVAGTTLGGLDGNAPAGMYDLFLAKYDPTGAREWTRQLGTSGNDRASSVAIDASGDLYLAGHTNGVFDGSTNAGSNDLLVVKYDTTGTRQWTRQLGSSGTDNAESVATDANGNVYAAGSTGGSLDGNNYFGSHDLFLVKYSSTGTKQWTRQLGTTGSDIANGVAIDGDGNVYVAGSTDGELGGNINDGSQALLLVKFDPEGSELWLRQLGSSGIDIAHDVVTDASGNIYMAGDTDGALPGHTASGGSDMVLVKYDPAGSVVWAQQYGSSGNDYVRSVAVDASGNIYLAGYTYGGLDGHANAGGSDLFVVKFDPAGVAQWAQQLGTDVLDQTHGVVTDASGSLYVAGYTDGGLDGNVTFGGTDLFLVKYGGDGVKQ